jgi:hypothetical protein
LKRKEVKSSVVLAGPLGTIDKVDERGFSLLPATSLKTAIWVDEEERAREDVEHRLETILDFLTSRDTRRVDIIDTRANLVGVSIMFEGIEELHVSLGSLDGDDISIKTLDGGEDVVEV